MGRLFVNYKTNKTNQTDNKLEEKKDYNTNQEKENSSGCLIFILVFILLGILGMAFGGESKYERDFRNMQDKTYDEMTDDEQEVYEDYLNWYEENND